MGVPRLSRFPSRVLLQHLKQHLPGKRDKGGRGVKEGIRGWEFQDCPAFCRACCCST